MPGTNDFLTFAAGGAANVLTQAQYAALTTILANGFTSGTAVSQQLNKVWRQSSIMSAVLGTFIANVTNQNVVDDGTTATILSNLMTAVMLAGYADDTGAVNAYAITLSPAPLAYYDGMKVGFSTVNANTTTNPTLNVNGLGAITITGSGGSALVAGQIPANAINELVYNSTGPRFELCTNQSNGITPAQFDNSTKLATMAALQRALGNFSGVSFISTTPANLTASNSGQTIIVAVANAVINLPAASTVGVGTKFTLEGYTTTTSTITRAGTDTIRLGGNSNQISISLEPGGTVEITAESATGWVVTAGSASLPGSALFGSSIAANGYQKLPSGLIIQWGGSTTVTAGTALAVNMPISFPNAGFGAFAQTWQGTGTATIFGQAFITSLSQVSLEINTGTASLFWFAIGH